MKKLNRAKKYNCDGNCYPDFGLTCPRSWDCPETKLRERVSLAFVMLLFIIDWALIIFLIIKEVIK